MNVFAMSTVTGRPANLKKSQQPATPIKNTPPATQQAKLADSTQADTFKRTAPHFAGGNPSSDSDERLSPTNRLIQAIYRDDRKTFDTILQDEDLDLNQISETYGKPPICAAAWNKDNTWLQALLNRGANINQADETGETALHTAVTRQDMPKLEILLKAQASVNKPNTEGLTPFHIAARTKNPNLLSRLIIAGGNISQATNDGLTPLHEAASRDNAENIKLLLAQNADTSRIDNYGATPLDTLCQYSMHDALEFNPRKAAAIKLLLPHGTHSDQRTAKTGQKVQPDPEVLKETNEYLGILLEQARNQPKKDNTLIKLINHQLHPSTNVCIIS